MVLQWLRPVAQDFGNANASANVGTQCANDGWDVEIDALKIGTWQHLCDVEIWDVVVEDGLWRNLGNAHRAPDARPMGAGEK
eukprot:2317113-Prorocentrum_lima.AAC.1